MWYDINEFLLGGEMFMSLTRKDSRVLAMAILYQVNLFERKKIEYELEKVIEQNIVNIEENCNFVKELVNGVLGHEEELVELANRYLEKWDISRLGLTDAAILKIAIYELLYTDTPNRVCIDEAIELSKDYSDEKVIGMINGVLDKVYHNHSDIEE